MLRILLTVVLTVAIVGCDDGAGSDGNGRSPGDATPVPSATTDQPTPSASATFGSSVTTETADVQSDLEVRVAETISEFEGRQVEEGTLLTVPAEVLFDVDEASLRPAAVATLDRLVEVVQFHADFPLEVTGHTDSDGSDEYNQDLSERRAAAVAEYLTEQGVDAGRIRIEGRGEAEPVAPNDTEDGKQQNRRVELLLVGADAADQ